VIFRPFEGRRYAAAIGRVCALLVVLASAAACRPAFQNSQPSPDALGREVLLALERRDEVRLRALSLSAHEFERKVWPELPAARPERNMPWSYVWMDLRQKSEAMLQRTLAAHGGRRYELEEVTFDGPTTEHGNYRVARDSRLMVRDASGARQELRILGSMISGDEGWKVFSYIFDH
jgi:hypothetical protein